MNCISEGNVYRDEPGIAEHMEKRIRRDLIEKLEPLLFSGDYYGIKITREEREADCEAMWVSEEMYKIRYIAEIRKADNIKIKIAECPPPIQPIGNYKKTVWERIKAAIRILRG